MFGFALIDIPVFIAGGALIWFEKDRFLAWYQGAEAFATKLKADAAALEAKAATIKAAVATPAATTAPATPAAH